MESTNLNSLYCTPGCVIRDFDIFCYRQRSTDHMGNVLECRYIFEIIGLAGRKLV